MKKLILAIPEYMYSEIEFLQPFTASTITGTIIQMIDHGINYEYKKKRKYIEEKIKKDEEAKKKAEKEKAEKEKAEKEKNQQQPSGNPVTIDQDQKDNNKKLMQTLALAKKPIREYFDSEKDYQEQFEKWLREFEKFI